MSLESGPIGPMKFMSPDAGQPSRVDGPLLPHENPYDRILGMNDQELFDYIRGPLIDAECRFFEIPDPESYRQTALLKKLVFAGGSMKRDIAEVELPDNESVYEIQPTRVKYSEADEFLAKASGVINDDEPIEPFVSEAADLFFNYSFLADIDKNIGHRGKAHKHAPDYIYLMSQIAGSLGWDTRSALLIAAMKYHRRYNVVGKKDPAGEKELMRGLLYGTEFNLPVITIPDIDQVNASHKIVENITVTTIHNRYKEVVAQKKLAAGGHVYPGWSSIRA